MSNVYLYAWRNDDWERWIYQKWRNTPSFSYGECQHRVKEYEKNKKV